MTSIKCRWCGKGTGYGFEREGVAPLCQRCYASDYKMTAAFADLAAEILPMVEQEVADVLTLWDWIQERDGGCLFHDFCVLFIADDTDDRMFSEEEHGADWLHIAAEWVRDQKRGA